MDFVINRNRQFLAIVIIVLSFLVITNFLPSLHVLPRNDPDMASTTFQPNTPIVCVEKCEKRLPRAILVGKQKSGTTALLNFFNYHPQIAACMKPEEPRYFNDNYNYSLEWYRNLMPCSTSDQVTIEKSPTYFYGNTTALRIKQMNDKIKIMIVLKEPVEVLISMYSMWRDLKRDFVRNVSFEDMVTSVNSNGERTVDPDTAMVKSAKYIIHVKTWIDVFGKDQVLVLDGGKLEHDPAAELGRVEKFLGLVKYFDSSQFVFNKTKNKFCFSRIKSKDMFQCLYPSKGRKHIYVSNKLQQMLRAYFRPYNLLLTQLLNQSFVWM